MAHGNKRVFNKGEKDKIKHLFDSNYTHQEISDEMKCSRYIISREIKEMGLKRMRNRGRVIFKYEIGDIVNDSLIIVNRIADPENNIKSYEVKSIAYPEAPTYITKEYVLASGAKCAYSTNSTSKKIFEGNSLYSVVKIRKFLIDVEYAKTIAPTHKEKILFRCPNCKTEKSMLSANLIKHGIMCPVCSNGTSYPEKLFLSYNEVLGLNFKHQVKFKDFPKRIFDFVDHEKRIIVETHGKQHYDENSAWYKNSQKSDAAKRKWCKENGYILIELDCSESTFEFICNSINECDFLPNIETKNKEYIIKTINKHKNHKIKEILKMYDQGYTYNDIAKEHNISTGKLYNLLKKFK